MPGNELVQSLVRGVKVLEVIVDAEREIRLNDIVKAVGLKTTTVHNLLRTLVAQEYVEKANGSGYLPGPMVIKLVASPFKRPRNYPAAIPVFNGKNNFTGALGVNFREYDKNVLKKILPEVLKVMRKGFKTVNNNQSMSSS